ncbi:exopolyphosphatase [Marinicellulosiphila megalodicopiae]|uniref:Ppx/GppA phosphatase family protein n=1 Tax=Marinicellulosiphila megalodicopiae TaxID=2724896 RepID=UPI003BB0C470
MSENNKIVELESNDPSKAVNVAALDIGSNSFHLVVARIVDDSVQILHRVKQKVRMANGLDKNKMLSEESIVKGLTALENIKGNIDGFHPDKIRIVATYTLRTAVNANEFIHRALDIFPFPVEVISGFEEARLIYSGVAHTHHEQGKRLVMDIGGGSTEFIIGEEFSPHILRSLSMGCVSFNKRFFDDGYITMQRFRRAIMHAQLALEPHVQLYKIVGWDHCIGTSGSIKSILAVTKAISGQENRTHITLEDLIEIQKRCCELDHSDTLNLPGLSDDRRAVFCAGLSILMAAFYKLDIHKMDVSDSGLRDGVLYEMEDRLKNTDIRQRTAESLSSRYKVDTQQAARVLQTAKNLYQQCAAQWEIESDELSQMLNWAALLHEVGLNINSKKYHKHSGYIIANVDMPGFNQEQQKFLAELLNNQRKKISTKVIVYEQFDKKAYLRILVILRLAVLFNVSRQDTWLEKVEITVDKNEVSLIFDQTWFEKQTIFQMDLLNHIDLFESAGINLKFTAI